MVCIIVDQNNAKTVCVILCSVHIVEALVGEMSTSPQF